LSTAFFTPNLLIAIAASPPVEVTLPAIRAAVARQTGHMGFSLLVVTRDASIAVRTVEDGEVAIAAGIAKDPGLKPLDELQIFRGAKAPR
jgi:hypothetical protein